MREQRMKQVAGIAMLALAGAASAWAGNIVGTVRGAPPASPGAAAAAGAYESRRYKYVEKIDYDRLQDFVVYIDQPVAEANPTPPPRATVTTTQRDANFDPHVLAVAVGTTVRWPNEDEIFHNVFSMSDTKQFDLGYYKKTDNAPEIVFERAGLVDVFCAIHSRMHCIILVLPNRFFAKADDKGRFTIPNVPPGTYKLKAWHERLPAKTLEVVVPAQGEVKVNVTLSLDDLPKIPPKP
jgi:plastocyanin